MGNSSCFTTVWTGTKICSKCNQSFRATSGNQKKCPTCRICGECGKQLRYSHKRFCDNSCAGKFKYKTNEKVRFAIEFGLRKAHENAPFRSGYWTGKPRHDMRGEKNFNWKGGKGKERHSLMGRVEYKIWRSTVFQRDDYTCQFCKQRGGKLNAHHVIPFAEDEDLRLEISNGLTLCRDCHIRHHKNR